MFEGITQRMEVAKAAARLDIFDITYERSNETLAILDLDSSANPRKGPLARLASYGYWLMRYAAASCRHRGPSIPPRAVVFFASSKNEYDSLSPISNRLEDPHFIGPWGVARNNLSLFRAHWLGIFFLPLVLVRRWQSSGYRRASFAYILDQYLLGYGAYCAARMWLRSQRPALLIVSNHLAVINRALLKAAQDESITRLYFLHATISDVYPPLDTEYALLEGMDTLKKYDLLGSSGTRTFLVGMAKHDRCKSLINTSAQVRTVGLCINGLDPTERVAELCACIARSLPALRVIVRPHPADRRARHWAQLAGSLDFEFSDWKEEAAFDFLSRVDVNIAGDSGIHLEAALLNVMPLYYAFDHKVHDLYGFLRNGLVELARDPQACTSWLRKLIESGRPPCRHRAKRYCATVDTEWDWRSAELAHSIIRRIEADGCSRTDGWRRITAIGIEAYEPDAAATASTADS